MARPQNVGIKAMEIYFPKRVSVLSDCHVDEMKEAMAC